VPLPVDRSPTDPADDAAEHAADHNTVHAFVNDHAADTTAVHGIADTSVLETTTGSTAKVAAHEADATAAHAASAVAFTPTGAIAATDVQAALAEVDSEKSATGHAHSGTYVPVADLTAHESDTSTHGIADTSVLETTTHITASGKGFVNHGSTAGTARPSGYASVEWYGSVTPSNAITGDTWVDTA
jgi:hypothetical protein